MYVAIENNRLFITPHWSMKARVLQHLKDYSILRNEAGTYILGTLVFGVMCGWLVAYSLEIPTAPGVIGTGITFFLAFMSALGAVEPIDSLVEFYKLRKRMDKK